MARGATPVLLVALAFGCDDRRVAPEAGGAEAGADARSLSLRLARALSAGDSEELVSLAPREPEVRVEIRQSLAETDERSSETLTTAESLRAWLDRTRRKWSCTDGSCAWPGGLVTGDLARCAGDCCFSDYPNGLEKGVLHLRRVCWAAREGHGPRLSYLGFVEAK